MNSNDSYKLSTWGSLWRYVGIATHALWGFYYLLYSGKIADVKDFILYYLGLCNYKPPLFGEAMEDYYMRRVYTTCYDCFSRPLDGPPEHHIEIAERVEEQIKCNKRLILNSNDSPRTAINFGSYNYLGFGGRHPIVTKQIMECMKTKGVAITGTAAECGISEEQQQLEQIIATFLHKDDAIVVPMGFATNSTLIPILVGKGDVVFSDALNHNSIITGIKSSGAEVKVFKHNDMFDLQKKLEDLKKNGMKNGEQPKKVLLIAEGLYSMEGEYCPLKELIALKKAYGFYLYVDEAHSFGALGETGRGIVEHLGCNFNDVDILMGTFSKSFASSGGYLASDKQTIALLRSNCYSVVYGSPMSPASAQQIISVLELMKTSEGKQRIAQLRKNSINFRKRLLEAGCHVLGDTDSPVIPVLVYHISKVRDISRGCLKRGVAVVGVGYPACSITTHRIRFCISASHTDEDMDKTYTALIECLKETDSIFGDANPGDILFNPAKMNLEEVDLPNEPRSMQPLGMSDSFEVTQLPSSPSGINLASYDIHNLENNDERKEQLSNTIMNYGCGSCGPRAFYGTTVEHIHLENSIAKFFGTNDALTYSYGNNTLTSVVPIYGQPGDVLVVDEKCNYPIQLGCRLAKAKTIQYKHCDIDDLKQKVIEAKKKLKFPQKVVIVTEGIFMDDLQYAPLKEISKLRNTSVMVIVDDSLGIGSVGSTLKGSIEHCGLSINDIDVLCGSLETVCSTVGGFCVGNFSVLDRQRLFGAGYCFSAAAAPFTCLAGRIAFEQFYKNGEEMGISLRSKRQKFNTYLNESKSKLDIIGNEDLPFALVNAEEKNQKLVNTLKDNGFYAVLQKHLKDDWCNNEYVRINIGVGLDDENMIKLVKVLTDF
ncbi:serine C-palmitoyltransferase [Entamoeba marina]